MYESFDRFLRNAVREYYGRAAGRQKGDVVALLIASGQLVSAATDRVTAAPGKHIAAGAAAAVALRVGFGLMAAGPVGLVVGGLTLAALTSFLLRNQRAVGPKVEAFAAAIDETRVEYERLQQGHADGRYDDDDRALLIDGLTARLLKDLDARARRAEADAAAAD